MAKRTIGAERLFSLGNYKNLRLIESVEFDDEGFDDEKLDLIRYANILNLYIGFAIHQDMLQLVKDTGFDPESIRVLVESERKRLEEDYKERLVQQTLEVMDTTDEVLEPTDTVDATLDVIDITDETLEIMEEIKNE